MKFSIFTFLSLTAVAGTESGGGGGVVWRGSHFVLVDYLNIDPHFVDKYVPHNNPMDLVQERLRAWQNLRFDLVGLLVQTGFSGLIDWQFTEDVLFAPQSFRPQSLTDSEVIETAALYTARPPRFSIRIRQPLWQQMKTFAQAGLLMHESVRHVQIGHSNRFDEQTLQQATALLMMCAPTARLSFYANYLILNAADLAAQLYGAFDEVIRKDCKRI